jgi:hypothetical protein
LTPPDWRNVFELYICFTEAFSCCLGHFFLHSNLTGRQRDHSLSACACRVPIQTGSGPLLEGAAGRSRTVRDRSAHRLIRDLVAESVLRSADPDMLPAGRWRVTMVS